MDISNNRTKWSYEKGIYCPPTNKFFPNILRRQITISDHIHEKIGLLIGKSGEHFIHLTQKYNLLYIFYVDQKIELYGLEDENLMKAVHELIKKIKYMNYMKRMEELKDFEENKKQELKEFEENKKQE